MKLSTKVRKRIDHYHPEGNLDHTAKVILDLCGVNHLDVEEHSERVSLLAEAVAIEMKKDAKAAFFAGLLHDTGKITHPHELFDGRNITEDEYAEVKKHARDGFEALKGRHIFIALCAGLHHAVFHNGYGLTIDVFPKEWHMGTVKKILEIAAIVSVCDFIDAFTHRDTEIKDGPSKAKGLKELLYEKYPEDHLIVDIALRKNAELKL